MNIFVLSEHPRLAARYHCDKHVGKMLMEASQMLSTTVRHYLDGPPQDGPGELYKPTHAKHPCTLWVKNSRQNFLWLCDLARGLAAEHEFRFGTSHRSYRVAQVARDFAYLVPDLFLTPFAQALPEEMKDPRSAVTSYRRYYHTKIFARWHKATPPPKWWKGSNE